VHRAEATAGEGPINGGSAAIEAACPRRGGGGGSEWRGFRVLGVSHPSRHE